MRWLKLTLAYDGTSFSGWQRQEGRRTVQGVFESAWQAVTGERIRTSVSGRTDAGVHALGQVVGMATDSSLTSHVLARALNARLPDDVAVRHIEDAPVGFNATSDAISKRYRYVMQLGRGANLFQRAYAWRLFGKIDAHVMHDAAQVLVGTHDFASFQSVGSPRETTVRTIFEVSVQGRAGEWGEEMVLEIVGNGFLYNMVRAIVGTLLEIGRGNRNANWLAGVLASKDRRNAGQTAPAHGLFLVDVQYPPGG